VQSHLAEAEAQVKWVEDDRGMKDIDVFESAGLLTPRTIQAHCTYLAPSDLNRVRDSGTSIAHCPLSNTYFSAQPFKLREALSTGVKVGLGTDIAGGYSVDMMCAMRQAVIVSRMRENEKVAKGEKSAEGENENLAINWKESLYLATRGGAIALNLPPGTGVFEVGAPFDAQQISVYDAIRKAGIGPIDFFDEVNGIEEDLVEKWWCIGDTRNRRKMWVQGVEVTRDEM